MFFASFGLLILAAVSLAVPAPPSDVKLWTGEEALAAGLLKVVPGPPEGLASLNSSVNPALGPSPQVFSNQIGLWNNTFPGGTFYDPGTFAQGFFFCVDLTLRDTSFNDQAGSFFVATDTSCNLFINAGCTGTGIVDAPRGDFVTLTGIFFKSITSLSCEFQP
ncbi:hypothetical protein DFH08DRAFT_176129 [Mycena albidolilacea]|uniref:Uncharacterized protein n=1 Tax=Mycena albidolilacea TaxID=1033008 RepID=A0AAD7ARU1_9AGAR|nr:hypothetical protein DFH08DRAFT_176129 [Mycena albidolilacea]